MTHFGIICPPFPGHLNPLAALGRELKSRGHRVTCLQIGDLELKVWSEGLSFYPIGSSSYQPGSLAETFKQIGKLSGLEALHYSVSFCQKVAQIICEDAPSAIEATGIEFLLVDQLEPAGETVAELLGIPFISICCAQVIHRTADIPPFFTPWSYQNSGWAHLRNRVAYYLLDRGCQPILQVINQYRQQWKLPACRHLYVPSRALAQISQQPAAFDFPCAELPQQFHYVGPLRNPSPQIVSFPFEQLTGQPLIYASLGSVQNTKHNLFRDIAAACQGLDAQLVITHGRSMDTEGIEQLPGSPLVVEYAPQLEVISKAGLTITHGGLNTVLDSLTYGVPLVAIPITYEQPGTGARIRWTGTGEVLPVSALSIPRLQAAIQRVLTGDSYLRSAKRLKQEIHEAGGVNQAANIVEQVLNAQDSAVLPLTSGV
ncbi:glycosyltransferase [Leptolyngbya sp. FACHB-261]|uniref:glycosyltransferase n=1 Tax=Leptolyngbya sp. FACHB-261 TaxID=2692806 RepID=UPI001686DA95|nr:glycosyltransferase [Leptolyngbya sp. FACHB-261]MBD2100079.1 glycosyltransferase [Leptolyngbya sp. FACHB-261]